MRRAKDMPGDRYDLNRFLAAQEDIYDDAVAEIRAGRKKSHWMWFIFPQSAGLGFSSTSQHFAISSAAEAGAYLAHPVLGRRLVECAEATLSVEGRTARDIFGSPDDLKLRSSLTGGLCPPDPLTRSLASRCAGSLRSRGSLAVLARRSLSQASGSSATLFVSTVLRRPAGRADAGAAGVRGCVRRRGMKPRPTYSGQKRPN